jgi:hypothetical protein
VTYLEGEVSDAWLDRLVKLAEESRPEQLCAVARLAVPQLVREVKALRLLVDKLRRLERKG